MKIRKILLVFGTRPEAIKMAPVFHRLKDNNHIDVRVCVTGQHRQMLDQVLDLFDITADYDFNLMKPNQTLEALTSDILISTKNVLDEFKPDLTLVHGDTTTSFSAALASFYSGVKVGHVEAGLRTGNDQSPWPEEINRKLTAGLASYHFAPTAVARRNLINENVDSNNICVSGNTVIDALLFTQKKIESNADLQFSERKKFGFLGEKNKKIWLPVIGERTSEKDLKIFVMHC